MENEAGHARRNAPYVAYKSEVVPSARRNSTAEDLRTWGGRACLVSRGRRRSSGVVGLRMIADDADDGGGADAVTHSTCCPSRCSGAGVSMSEILRSDSDVSAALAGRIDHRRVYRPAEGMVAVVFGKARARSWRIRKTCVLPFQVCRAVRETTGPPRAAWICSVDPRTDRPSPNHCHSHYLLCCRRREPRG